MEVYTITLTDLQWKYDALNKKMQWGMQVKLSYTQLTLE